MKYKSGDVLFDRKGNICTIIGTLPPPEHTTFKDLYRVEVTYPGEDLMNGAKVVAYTSIELRRDDDLFTKVDILDGVI